MARRGDARSGLALSGIGEGVSTTTGAVLHRIKDHQPSHELQNTGSTQRPCTVFGVHKSPFARSAFGRPLTLRGPGRYRLAPTLPR